MSSRRAILALALACAPSAVLAASGGAPITLAHSGYLLDGADQAVGTAQSFTFALFPGESATGTPEWSASCTLPVQGGYYAVVLGSTACPGGSLLETSDLPPGSTRWLEVSVGGTTLTPRLAISPQPAAALAADAQMLGGYAASRYPLLDLSGKLAASTLPAAGGDLSGSLASAQVTGLLGRALSPTPPTNGQALLWNDTANAWKPGSIAPGGITSLTAGTGLTGGTITTTGTIAVNVGTGPGQIVQLDSGGRLDGAILPTTIPGAHTFSGAVTLGSYAVIGSTTTTCAAGIEGALRYNASLRRVEFCDGIAWRDSASASTCPSAPQVLTYTGADVAISVPSGCNFLRVKAWGAGGGGGGQGGSFSDSVGGAGGYAYATVAVFSSDTFLARVGGGGSKGIVDGVSPGGFPGGGSGHGSASWAGGGGGGGYSGLFRTSVSQANVVVLAGGGGGGVSANGTTGVGGAGGGASGVTGGAVGVPAQGGGGGTGSTFGAAGASGGNAGSALQGGDGHPLYIGAGGGGGYFGGGGGGWTGGNGGGGGGGSGKAGTALQSALLAGSGVTPGNASDADRGGAGAGGAVQTKGGDGRIVLYWSATNNAPGNASESAATSCKALRDTVPGLSDGQYWLDPDGTATALAPFQAYCLMSKAGGGWTKVLQYDNTTNLTGPNAVNANGAWTTGTTGAGRLSDAAMAALWSRGQFLMRTASPSDGLFLANGAGYMLWTISSGQWPQFGTGYRPGNPSYSLACERTGDDVVDETLSYSTDNRADCTYGSFWLYDHNYTSTPQCFGFSATQFKSNLHFCGTGSTQSLGGTTGATQIYYRD